MSLYVFAGKLQHEADVAGGERWRELERKQLGEFHRVIVSSWASSIG
jgi:hypothetical protein